MRQRPKPNYFEVDLTNWVPKTELGRKVKAGDITSMAEILEKGYKVLESEIVDFLFPDLKVELLEVGQSKGKFGGGKKSIWKQTQKITAEGSVMKFSTFAVVGNENGFVGAGFGNARETVPARQKAIRNAKLSLIYVPRGSGSWVPTEGVPHSIPFAVSGSCSSVTVTLKPAPMGAGLVMENKCKKILALAGIKDVYSKSAGKTATRLNSFKATFDALKNLSKVRTVK
jgi:small subunit ribosomal protein S5